MKVLNNTIIENDKIIVRFVNINSKDLDTIFNLWTNPKVMNHVGFPNGIPTTKEKIKNQLISEKNSIFDAILMIDLKETGETIGHCFIDSPDKNSVSELDLKLLPEHWGKGFGTITLNILISYIFNNSNALFIQGTPNKNNLRSIKMQEKCNMKKTGEQFYEFPDNMKEYTKSIHTLTYRISREEWKRI